MALAGRRGLAGGTIVETRLCARLLGIKLLVVDGTVTLVPWRPIESPTPGELPARWAQARWHPGTPALVVNDSASDDADAGARLEACTRRLEASARRLEELRPS
jgi:hypothetical protein